MQGSRIRPGRKIDGVFMQKKCLWRIPRYVSLRRKKKEASSGQINYPEYPQGVELIDEPDFDIEHTD